MYSGKVSDSIGAKVSPSPQKGARGLANSIEGNFKALSDALVRKASDATQMPRCYTNQAAATSTPKCGTGQTGPRSAHPQLDASQSSTPRCLTASELLGNSPRKFR
jgi:hypothetical protein